MSTRFGAAALVARSAVRAKARMPRRGGGNAEPVPPLIKTPAPEASPPNGFLFGEKPGPRVAALWEPIYNYGILGGILAMGFMLGQMPDTSAQTWARGKALERLEGK